MVRILSSRDVETIREHAREQMLDARRIQQHCARLRAHLARQAADVAALTIVLRRLPASRMPSGGR